MSSYRVVAANGRMGLPAGWALPIIQDGEECHVIGDEAAQAFRADELAGLEDQGLIRVFQSPVDFHRRDAEEEAEVDIEFHRDLFPVHLYLFYFDQARFEKLNIDIESVLIGRGRTVSLQNEDMPTRRTFVVGRRSLICALEETCDKLHLQIMERLARHDWTSLAYLDDEDLRLLAKCYYDLSFNRSVARRAIARRGLIIQRSPNSDMLEEWLKAASRRWGFDRSLDYWSKKTRSVLESCKTCAYARRLYYDAIIEILARFGTKGKVGSKGFGGTKMNVEQFLNERQESGSLPGAGVIEELLAKPLKEYSENTSTE